MRASDAARAVPTALTPVSSPPSRARAGGRYFFSFTHTLRNSTLLPCPADRGDAGPGLRLAGPAWRATSEHGMNQHAVVPHLDAGVGHLFPLLVLRRRELHVVGLPRERRKAHVHIRLPQLVEAAAFVVLPLQTEGIEHLDLVTVVQVDAAIAPGLAAGQRHVREPELHVQRVIAEILLAGSFRQQISVGSSVPWWKFSAVLPSKSTTAPLAGFADSVGLWRMVRFNSNGLAIGAGDGQCSCSILPEESLPASVVVAPSRLPLKEKLACCAASPRPASRPW